MIKKNTKAGFSLFEMLISCAIITIVAGIAFYNHRQFNNDLEITNLAYRVAVTIRQAQVNSISVRQFSGASGEQYNVAYGVHFNKDVPDQFILYGDEDRDGMYTSGDSNDDMFCDRSTGSECIEKVTIGRGNIIRGWCGRLFSNSSTGCYFNGESDEHYLDISFRRPNPDALYSLYEDEYDDTHDIVNPVCDGGIGQISDCSSWAICLASPLGRMKQVVVYSTGQISVEEVDEGGEGEAGSVCAGGLSDGFGNDPGDETDDDIDDVDGGGDGGDGGGGPSGGGGPTGSGSGLPSGGAPVGGLSD